MSFADLKDILTHKLPPVTLSGLCLFIGLKLSESPELKTKYIGYGFLGIGALMMIFFFVFWLFSEHYGRILKSSEEQIKIHNDIHQRNTQEIIKANTALRKSIEDYGKNQRENLLTQARPQNTRYAPITDLETKTED